jgi:hypothetical protein
MMIKKLRQVFGGINKFTHLELSERTTFTELEKLARRESAEYIYNNLRKAILFENAYDYWSHLISKVLHTGLLMEFGVYYGNSINHIARQLSENNDKRIIYGFDSFEGLSENFGGTGLGERAMSLNGKMPDVLSNVHLIKGWVEDTFVPFLDKIESDEKSIAYMHLDMDVYTATKWVLENSIEFLRPGTIIDFDDLLGFPGWKEGEYKALKETLDHQVKYEHIAYCELDYLKKPYKGIVKSAIVITDC